MPEKCALSHGSGVLGRDPRDSCRFWSPHVENVCTVTQIRLGEGGGGGDTIGGGVGEPRTGIIYSHSGCIRATVVNISRCSMNS